jgi:hypothetical protein
MRAVIFYSSRSAHHAYSGIIAEAGGSLERACLNAPGPVL